MRIVVLPLALACILPACSGNKRALPPAPASAFPVTTTNAPLADYRIGAMDELSLVVFREPDLSIQVSVDASGNISLPLTGQLHAEGLTTTDLAAEVSRRLNRYIVDPRVTVNIARAVSLKATVDGRVNKPGIYDIDGRTTLLQAIARAEGETETANLQDVVIFRRTDQQLYAARFDIKKIRNGDQEDPPLRSGDTVVVGASSIRGIYQDFLKVAPFLGTVFIALRN